MLSFLFIAVAVYVGYWLGRCSRQWVNTSFVPTRVQQALDTLTEGLLIVDEHERILLANQAFTETTGISNLSLVGKRMGSLPWSCATASKTTSPWTKALAEATAQTDQLMLLRCNDQRERYLLINANPIMQLDRGVHGVLATFRDVTDVENRRAELEKSLAMMRTFRDQISNQNRELQHLASHDPLTGCLNRRAFFEELRKTFTDTDVNNEHAPIACLMVDSDHFKQINDAYGHTVGDDVLCRIASTLREVIGDAGIVCRYGGEEFCAILLNQDRVQVIQAAESIRSSIEELRFNEPAELRLTVSIGVSDFSDGITNEMELIDQADVCLYRAKRQGRNRVVVHDPSSLAEANSEFGDGETTPDEQAPRREQSLDDFDSQRMIPFEAVTALVSVLANRDSSTAEHSRRVADLCVQAATGLLDYRSTYILETAAMLHDIGKIGVPDQVLFKPGPLSRDEWRLIREYDRVGAGIIAGTFNCDELNEIIRCLHIPWGNRSAGETEIHGPKSPLAARLLAIADSYDSMRSDRAYRKGRSHDECIAELRRYANTQFDPQLVEHFAESIRDSSRGVSSLVPRSSSKEIPKRTALQIGMQIERLARAIDAKDTIGLRLLADKLAVLGREHRIDAISNAAKRLQVAAEDENTQWMRLLGDTQTLLGLCRATQKVFLSSRSVTAAAAKP